MAEIKIRNEIRFILNGSDVALSDVAPDATLLDWLRLDRSLRGTKEGCAEGDCGACTVVLGEVVHGHMRYRAVNACIMFVPALDGTQLLTVEHLRGADGSLHSVQRAMVEQHASQCGFCTPGFVMSLFAMHHAAKAVDRTAVNDALAGNLCRCTGYRPIVDAALAVGGGEPADQFSATGSDTVARLRALDTDDSLALYHGGQTWIAPRSVAELAEVLQEHSDAILLAGGTDVGLWVTKQHRVLETIVTLDAVRDMATIEEVDGVLRIGAAAVYEDALAYLEAHWPDFGSLVRRLGSRQIRNRGTIGGNIGNASPIGDTPPALIALGATVELRKGKRVRTVPIDEFFIDYGKQNRAPGELVSALIIPKLTSGHVFRCYKVAKRFDQDIASVMGAFRFTVGDDGIISEARIAFGGMAATPRRAKGAEGALQGAQLRDSRAWARAFTALREDFAPIDDHRASARYRAETAHALLGKALIESAGTGSSRTRVVGFREKVANGSG
jgi:xanthine dehydrogenase small subunit